MNEDRLDTLTAGYFCTLGTPGGSLSSTEISELCGLQQQMICELKRLISTQGNQVEELLATQKAATFYGSARANFASYLLR